MPIDSPRPVWLTGAFWTDTAERVITADAAVALAMLGNNAVNPSDIDWGQFGWTLLLTTVTRTLLCIAARSTNSSPVPNASFFLASGKQKPDQ